MANLVYPADVVDGVLKSASVLIHGYVDALEKQAGEIDSLKVELQREKAANANRVELDKVASAAPKGTSPEWATKFADALVDHAIIQPADREKYASACEDDPDAAARFAIKVLKFSEAPASQGHGIKSASRKSAAQRELEKENELWAQI